MRSEGLRQILSHPATYVAVHSRAILQSLPPSFSWYVRLYLPDYRGEDTLKRLFGGTFPPARDFLPALPMYLLIGFVCAGQYVLALAGLRLVSAARDGLTVLVLASAAYFLIMAGAVGDNSASRMRHPAMPAICVLAAFGACAATTRYWPGKTGDPEP